MYYGSRGKSRGISLQEEPCLANLREPGVPPTEPHTRGRRLRCLHPSVPEWRIMEHMVEE